MDEPNCIGRDGGVRQLLTENYSMKLPVCFKAPVREQDTICPVGQLKEDNTRIKVRLLSR